MQPQTPRLDYD